MVNIQGTSGIDARFLNCLLLQPFVPTVHKMDLILRSIERMLQMQLSMACRFKLQVLCRYNVKFSKMHNFKLDTLRLDKLKSTGGRRINIPWIYSPRIYHCATGTHVRKAEF
jgi:hypothetical protein